MHAQILIAALLLACNGTSGSTEVESPPAVEVAQIEPAAPVSAAGEHRHALTVATFNINFGNVDMSSIASAIARIDADLVFLQETNKQSQHHLEKSLGDQYPHTHFSDSSRRWAAGGFGFLSKLPLEAPRFVPAKHGLFGTFIADLKLGERVVRLINLHLSPIRVGRARNLAEVFSALRTMEEVHAKEGALIVDELITGQPTIIAGDLNSISTQVAPSLLRKDGFVDAIAETMKSPDEHRTWEWPIAGQDIGFRIDYIFHSPHFLPKSSEIVHCQASDHEAVVASLSWK